MAEKERFELSRRLTQPTPLAGEPLRPLGYFSKSLNILWTWRRERDSNPRCLSASLVFKTSAINRSAISPRLEPARTIITEYAGKVNGKRLTGTTFLCLSPSDFLGCKDPEPTKSHRLRINRLPPRSYGCGVFRMHR